VAPVFGPGALGRLLTLHTLKAGSEVCYSITKTYQACKVRDEQECDFLTILGFGKAIKNILCKTLSTS